MLALLMVCNMIDCVRNTNLLSMNTGYKHKLKFNIIYL
ncbi:DNA-dependent RNA polymerase subunit rpo19 [Vaccinia virus]|nr:DNA-dependent RNA polymerase subunit rpo19 [Vaccinia virus]